MKRVKVMLLAIAVIAFAAGTLAFKARYNTYFCTTFATTTLVAGQQVYTCTFTLNGQPVILSCPNLVLRKTTSPFAVTPTVCTTIPTTIDGEITCSNRICTTAPTKLAVE